MSFQQRYINEDPENGSFAAGFLTPEKNPDYFTVSLVPFYRCSLVMSGNGYLEDMEHHRIPLKPGSVYQISPFETMHLTPDPTTEWKEYRICIGVKAFQTLKAMDLLNASPVFQIDTKTYLLQWMPVLTEEIRTIHHAELFEAFFNTQKLLINIHKENLENVLSEKARIVESAKQILSTSFNQDISFPDIAARFQISHETFRKIFKEGTGMSPLQFQLMTRFHHAQRCLTDGMSVKETAIQTGYTDPFIFSKQFKKYIGQSPREYKKNTTE